MRLTDLAEASISQMIGRLLRRALLFAVLGAFALIAWYYASAAALVALAQTYGLLNAYMIMAAGYAVAALVALTVIYATRPKPVAPPEPAANLLSNPRNMQIAMLIEAVMLGYSMARKSSKS